MSTVTASDAGSTSASTSLARLVPGVLLSVSGLLMFGLHWRPGAYLVLLAAVALGFVADRSLGRDLSLIGFGIVVVSLVEVSTNIEWGHMLVMGAALAAAVLGPYLASRFWFRDHAVRFPVLTGKRWTLREYGYLVGIVALGYLILPVYMISTGVFENWPAATDAGAVFRLFLGTNALGIWDELFFICTCFALLRRHYPLWTANLLQAVIFTSFLWELGFHAWGPLLIFPFALIQGLTFTLTKSLSFVVAVHLLFDFVLFLVLIHAHSRDWFAIFLY
ncbi:CPBP family intramembrane metalloprotease [Labedella phragmitis]|uniref:CPBP family intramembrane metalloprotease n=1 Tax=Labedella phragmitis TaxID=2498849 RepID=A0A3S4A1X1_9MICO|nr:CPBP family glutamic-type intramembrane protease [Labedella phragmitis]RWZ49606.1 CPBP family intramembrane metalloprotease [Labedella phragmitis]